MHPGRQTSMSIYERVPFLEISVPSVTPGSTDTWASQTSCKSLGLKTFCKPVHWYEPGQKTPPMRSCLNAGIHDVTHLSTRPRIIKTHFPVQFVPKSFWRQNCRVGLLLPSCNFFFLRIAMWTTDQHWSFFKKKTLPFFLSRLFTWPAMPKTTPCPISTLTAWISFSQKLETGVVTSTDSWRGRVRTKHFHLTP